MRSLFFLAFPLLILTGCVTGGAITIDRSGELIPLLGHLGMGEDEDNADPVSGQAIVLIVALDGEADRTTTDGSGRFAFEVPSGSYHLGLQLPANLGDSGAKATDFLIRVEASEEPVGVEIVLVAELDEDAWHIHGHLFDDEDGDGEQTGDEATLEAFDTDVPFGSQRDMVINPPAEDAEPEEAGHSHDHG